MVGGVVVWENSDTGYDDLGHVRNLMKDGDLEELLMDVWSMDYKWTLAAGCYWLEIRVSCALNHASLVTLRSMHEINNIYFCPSVLQRLQISSQTSGVDSNR